MAVVPQYAVVYAPAVLGQMERVLAWWARHRDKAPGLLALELEHALALLGASPGLGQRASTARFGALRRVMLPRTRYHVYYRILEEERRVEVVLLRQGERKPLP